MLAEYWYGVYRAFAEFMSSMHLFADVDREPSQEQLADGAVLLRRFALSRDRELLDALREIEARAPFRHMVTPGGFTMSVAMTNCGSLGWVSEETGYRYDTDDPVTGDPWPAMPPVFLALATEAASAGGYAGFIPDACLINRYEPGARLTLHQDRNERDFRWPIVSVSLGLPAVFQFGGMKRAEPLLRVALEHGDVAVWGGPARLRYHGVKALKESEHPLTGRCRINLTFRRAG